MKSLQEVREHIAPQLREATKLAYQALEQSRGMAADVVDELSKVERKLDRLEREDEELEQLESDLCDLEVKLRDIEINLEYAWESLEELHD